jgi:translation initiation factor IF-3
MSIAINGKIKIDKALVIDSNGNQLGTLTIKDAQNLADTSGLDLVQVSEGKNNVCKIMNHSKHLYDEKKKLKNGNDGRIKLKEVQLSANIGLHDLQVKANNAMKMINKGHKVIVVLSLKGRENDKKQLFIGVLENFKNLCENIKVERDTLIEGKKITMIISKSKVEPV